MELHLHPLVCNQAEKTLLDSYATAYKRLITWSNYHGFVHGSLFILSVSYTKVGINLTLPSSQPTA